MTPIEAVVVEEALRKARVRWTFELAQAFNRRIHEAVKRYDPEWVRGEEVGGHVWSEWRWPAVWQDAIYDEVFGVADGDEEDVALADMLGVPKPGCEDKWDASGRLADILGEHEVMELHNCGARILPTVDCMREQALAEFLNLDREESAERDGTGPLASWVSKEWFLDTDGVTWVPKKWSKLVGGEAYGCLTCQGIGGHFIGCPQRGAP